MVFSNQYDMSIKDEYYKQYSKNTNEEESLPFVNFVENTKKVHNDNVST